MNKKVLLIAGTALILIAIAIYTRVKNSGLPVKIVETQNRAVEKTVSANGSVVSKNSVDLSFPASGVISKVYVEKGETVSKGQIAALLNSSSASETANALKDARDIAIRNKDIYIYDHRNDSQESRNSNDYKLQIRKYDELISQAEASYQAQRSTLNNYKITAPFAGTILEINKKDGETAVAASTVIKIADLNNVHFEIDLDQEDYGFVREDQSAEITLDSYDNGSFNGKVTMLTRYAQKTATGDERFLVEISIETEEDRQISLGMTGDADIIVEKTDQEVQSLDYDAVYNDGEKHYVWTAENGVLHKEDVDIGLRGDLYTEIKTDLSGKTIVIPVNGTNQFKEGIKIKVVQ